MWREFSAWLAVCDSCGIVPGARPDAEVLTAVGRSAHLLCSPLRRARETAAAALAAAPGDRQLRVRTGDALHEAPLPALTLGGIRLPLDAWDVLNRLLWLLGHSPGLESSRGTVARPRSAADVIEGLVADGPVTVVAHGYQNILLARRLRRRGWRGPLLPGLANGSVTAYSRTSGPAPSVPRTPAAGGAGPPRGGPR